MEFEQLQAFMFVLMSICGGIITIGGVVALIVKLYQWARRPTDENTAKVSEFETFLASDKRRIETMERRQDETDAQNRLQLKALVTLLGHEIDGNHTEQLKSVRDEIQDYLISK